MMYCFESIQLSENKKPGKNNQKRDSPLDSIGSLTNLVDNGLNLHCIQNSFF